LMKRIRKAHVEDVETIYRLIKAASMSGAVLARPVAELYETVRDFHVYQDERAMVRGCCALHVTWSDLAELRSLVVDEAHRGQGVGTALVRACIEEARRLRVRRVFALTSSVGFFTNLGFVVIDKHELPHKVWADCTRCVKFPDCDETPVLYHVGRDKQE